MSLDFISDLRCLVMLDGTVFGNVEKASAQRPMEIRLGDALSPFELCDQNPEPALDRARIYRFATGDIVRQSHSLPAETVPGEVYACWVNNLRDWTLSGAQTIQLMINRYEAPCQVFFDTRITVPPGRARHDLSRQSRRAPGGSHALPDLP